MSANAVFPAFVKFGGDRRSRLVPRAFVADLAVSVVISLTIGFQTRGVYMYDADVASCLLRAAFGERWGVRMTYRKIKRLWSHPINAFIQVDLIATPQDKRSPSAYG